MRRICPRRSGLSLQEKPSNLLPGGKANDESIYRLVRPPTKRAIGKPSTGPKVRRQVRRLQLRIAKAIRAGHYGKAHALPWLLTHSHSAKLLAVKRVTENKGAKTPGVDNVIWRTDKQKYAATQNLKRRGYRPLPFAGTTSPRRTASCARSPFPPCWIAPCKRSTRWL